MNAYARIVAAAIVGCLMLLGCHIVAPDGDGGGGIVVHSDDCDAGQVLLDGGACGFDCPDIRCPDAPVVCSCDANTGRTIYACTEAAKDCAGTDGLSCQYLVSPTECGACPGSGLGLDCAAIDKSCAYGEQGYYCDPPDAQ